MKNLFIMQPHIISLSLSMVRIFFPGLGEFLYLPELGSGLLD